MRNPMLSQMTTMPSDTFVRLCNEKLLAATRDLADFTYAGINADFIVTLAYKCEAYEHLSQQVNQDQAQLDKLRNEIQQCVLKICETGQKIWEGAPIKYQNYVISGFLSKVENSAAA